MSCGAWLASNGVHPVQQHGHQQQKAVKETLVVSSKLTKETGAVLIFRYSVDSVNDAIVLPWQGIWDHVWIGKLGAKSLSRNQS